MILVSHLLQNNYQNEMQLQMKLSIKANTKLIDVTMPSELTTRRRDKEIPL